MRRTVFAVVVALAGLWLVAVAPPAVATDAPTVVPAVAPDDTVNPFLPEDRSLGECISALPKPGCGSEARGGWRQGVVLAAIVTGLAIIVWRVVVGARRAREGVSRTPAATTVPDDGDDDRAP